jgi:hypothetical protein
MVKTMIKIGFCDLSAAFSLLVIFKFNPTADEVGIWGTRYQHFTAFHRDYDDQLMRGMVPSAQCYLYPKHGFLPFLTLHL